MRLTKTKIDQLTYQKEGNKPHIVFDDEVAGFAVRVYPSGSKSFLIDYRVNGRQRRMVLGRYGVLTLDQARKLAQQKLADVLSGDDPIEQKHKRHLGETVETLCHTFIEQYAKIHKRSWGEDDRRIRIHIIPAIGKMKIQVVKRSDIIAFHNRLGEKHPYEANRNLALLSVMFEFGKKNGYLPEDHNNPARGIQKFVEHKRDRWLKPEEIPQLVESISKHENIYVRATLMLYLLTGVRKRELLRSKWSDVDLKRGELRIPDVNSKNNRYHYVPLSKPAIKILSDLPRQENNQYVLPGKKQGQHLVNIDIPWRKIRKESGLEDVRLHDLRRTVGSWLATSGHSLHIVGRILGHSDISTTQSVYAHLSQDPLKAAMEEHGEKIIDIAMLKEKQENAETA